MELRKENWKIIQLQENYPELWSCSKNIRPKIAVLTPSGQISHLQTLSSCHADILTSSVILHHQVQAGKRRNIAWAPVDNGQGTWCITAKWVTPQMSTVKGQRVETPQNLSPSPPPFFFIFYFLIFRTPTETCPEFTHSSWGHGIAWKKRKWTLTH